MSVHVRRGHVLLLRMVEAADSIDLDAAATALGSGGTHRVRLRRQVSESLAEGALPLEVDVGSFTLPAPLGGVEARLRARVFAFGVVSIVVEVPIAAGATLAELARLVAAASDQPALEAHVRGVVVDLARRLRPASTRPVEPSASEDYAIVVAREIEGDPLDDRESLARLLLAEPSDRPLAAARRDDVLARPHRWFADDLVLLAYDAAFVVEPGETSDLATVLELARTQLLEFRAYDAEIDRELDAVYRALARARQRGFWFRGEGFARARDVIERLVELTDLAESADNATKFASDLYFASLYLDALDRFRVADWRNAIARKLALFARAYELLKSEGDVRRATVLELVVIALIALEMVLAAWRLT